MDVLTASGVVPPKSWNEMITAVRKMTRIGVDQTVTRYGYAAPQGAADAIYSLHLAMEQLGKGLLYIGDTRAEIHNDRGIKAANYLRDLWQAGMPDRNTGVATMANSLSGKVAIEGYATYNLLDIDPEDTAPLAPRRVVGPEPGQDIVRYNSGIMYILPTSKHPNEAWRVLSAFVNRENSEAYIRAQVSYLPVRKSVLSKLNMLITHPIAAKMASIMYSPMTTYGAIHGLWTSVWPVGGPILADALQGKTGIDGALQEAENMINKLLAEQLGIK